jgi:hypothetical protein
MTKLVTLTLTADEALDVRMALNAASMSWGERASAAREAGNYQEALSCEDIRAGYGKLWARVQMAQDGVRFDHEAPAEAADRRYEHVHCATCGKNWQRIDWGSVAHAYFCDGAKTAPPDGASDILQRIAAL